MLVLHFTVTDTVEYNVAKTVQNYQESDERANDGKLKHKVQTSRKAYRSKLLSSELWDLKARKKEQLAKSNAYAQKTNSVI